MAGAGELNKELPDTNVYPSESLVKLEPFTDHEAAEIGGKLEKRLGPEWVASRQGPGGSKLHYLTGEKAIILANTIFGWRGWSSAVKDVKVDFVDEHNGKVSLGVSIIMRITLKDGTYHEDIGYGTSDNVKGKGQAFEKARKAAVTDGLKRALRKFGNLMGSCLYDKSYLNQISKMKAMPVKYNPDDFYRHPEFVPIKKEDVPVVAPVPEQAQNTNLVADYDDDEMGAFETAEFDEPPKIEEINGGDDPPETRETAGPGKITGPVRNASVSVNTSGMSMMARYKAEQAAVAAAAVVSAAKLLMAGHKNQATRQVSANHPRPPNLDPQALYINPDGMSNREPMAAEAIYSPSERNPPVSFYSARAAPDPQSGTIAGGQHHEQLFNPHSESPSLAKRWSSKIDHTKSGAIKREQATTDGGSHVTGQATVVEPVGGMSRPQLPADFISPHLDPNRMVGMPRGVVTPGRNASSFKPPGMLKRPLAEVSNGRANSMANLGADVGRLASKPPAEASDQSDPKRPKLVA